MENRCRELASRFGMGDVGFTIGHYAKDKDGLSKLARTQLGIYAPVLAGLPDTGTRFSLGDGTLAAMLKELPPAVPDFLPAPPAKRFRFLEGHQYTRDFSIRIMASCFRAAQRPDPKPWPLTLQRIAKLCGAVPAGIEACGVWVLLRSGASAVRHALYTAESLGKDRVVYVTPFIRDLQAVSADIGAGLGLERWWDSRYKGFSAPLVLSTAQSVFEDMYSRTPNNLHCLANAVIVVNAPEALDHGLLAACARGLEELALNYGSVVVLCSEILKPFFHTEVKFAPLRELQPKREYSFRTFEDIDALCEELKEHSRVLCIVNTPEAAREVYDRLSCYHLSARMYPEHIRSTVEEIRQQTGACCVVATDLTQLGVVREMFDVVYRESAGLESCVSSGGREVRVFCLNDRRRLLKAEITRAVLSECGTLEGSSAREAFYKRYFAGRSKDYFDRHNILKRCGEFAGIAKDFKLIRSSSLLIKEPVEVDPERPWRTLSWFCVGLRGYEMSERIAAGTAERSKRYKVWKLKDRRLYHTRKGLL